MKAYERIMILILAIAFSAVAYDVFTNLAEVQPTLQKALTN